MLIARAEKIHERKCNTNRYMHWGSHKFQGNDDRRHSDQVYEEAHKISQTLADLTLATWGSGTHLCANATVSRRWKKRTRKTHSRCESRNANIVDVHHPACSKCSIRYYPAMRPYVLTFADALTHEESSQRTTHQSKLLGCSNCNASPKLRKEKRTAHRNFWE